MRSANHSAPLQGLRLYKALLGLIQASGLAGGFDFVGTDIFCVKPGLEQDGGAHAAQSKRPRADFQPGGEPLDREALIILLVVAGEGC